MNFMNSLRACFSLQQFMNFSTLITVTFFLFGGGGGGGAATVPFKHTLPFGHTDLFNWVWPSVKLSLFCHCE